MIKFPKLIQFGAIILVLGTVPAAQVQAAKINKDPNGFKEYQWGSSLAVDSSFRLVKDLGSTDFVSKAGIYEKPGETLTLNGVPIIQIRYRFIDELLESVQLQYEGRENRDHLLHWLEERFGKVSVFERKMINAVQWFGEQTTVTLSYDSRTRRGKLWFMSQALNHRFNEFDQGAQGD